MWAFWLCPWHFSQPQTSYSQSRVLPHMSSVFPIMPFVSALRISSYQISLCVILVRTLWVAVKSANRKVWSGQHPSLRGRKMFPAAGQLRGKCRADSGDSGTDEIRLFGGCGENVILHTKVMPLL